MTTWIIIGLLVVILLSIYLVGIDLWTGRLVYAVVNGFKEQQREFTNNFTGLTGNQKIILTKIEELEGNIQLLRDKLMEEK